MKRNTASRTSRSGDHAICKAWTRLTGSSARPPDLFLALSALYPVAPVETLILGDLPGQASSIEFIVDGETTTTAHVRTWSDFATACEEFRRNENTAIVDFKIWNRQHIFLPILNSDVETIHRQWAEVTGCGARPPLEYFILALAHPSVSPRTLVTLPLPRPIDGVSFYGSDCLLVPEMRTWNDIARICIENSADSLSDLAAAVLTIHPERLDVTSVQSPRIVKVLAINNWSRQSSNFSAWTALTGTRLAPPKEFQELVTHNPLIPMSRLLAYELPMSIAVVEADDTNGSLSALRHEIVDAFGFGTKDAFAAARSRPSDHLSRSAHPKSWLDLAHACEALTADIQSSHDGGPSCISLKGPVAVLM